MPTTRQHDITIGKFTISLCQRGSKVTVAMPAKRQTRHHRHRWVKSSSLSTRRHIVTRSVSIRHTSGISGGFRQLRIYDSAVMANFGTFVMRPKEDTARDKLIPRKLVRQSRGDTKDEDVICHHSAHCRQILSIKTPLSSPSNSRIDI